MPVTLTFTDSRFNELPLTKAEKLEMIKMMIKEGTFDLRDAFVSDLNVTVEA